MQTQACTSFVTPRKDLLFIFRAVTYAKFEFHKRPTTHRFKFVAVSELKPTRLYDRKQQNLAQIIYVHN